MILNIKNIHISNSIYLDACSTSPPLQEVVDVVQHIQKKFWANPSSLHQHGLIAAEILEKSRISIARSLNAQAEEVFFTSGATESNYLAIRGAAKHIYPSRIIISSIEHPAVYSAANSLTEYGWSVEYWPVDEYGQIKLDLTDKMLAPPTKILSVMWAQNEVGTVQPIDYLGKECKKRGIIFHTDATQLLSQGTFDWSLLPVDLLTASPHKLQGPKGIGFLLIKTSMFDRFSSIQAGGPQESGYRAGTEAVSLAAGSAVALSRLKTRIIYKDDHIVFPTNKTKLLTKQLQSSLEDIRFIEFTGHPINRLPHHISMILSTPSSKAISGRKVVYELAKRGISVSSGSACSSGLTEDSRILASMGIPKSFRQSGLRISLGPWLSSNDLLNVPEQLVDSIKSII